MDNWRWLVVRYDWYTQSYVAFLTAACFMTILQGPAHLGKLPLPGQLLLQALLSLGIDREDAVAVTRESQGDASILDALPEQQEVVLGVLLFPEEGLGDGAGGIIDRSHQGQVGAAAF